MIFSKYVVFSLFFLVACSLLSISRFLLTSSIPHIYIFDQRWYPERSLGSNNSEDTSSGIQCDRTGNESDICFMRGDIRTDSSSSTIFLHSSSSSSSVAPQEEKIRPYTRKWDVDIRDRIDELRLTSSGKAAGPCHVQHDAPAIVFHAGGYTGNVYHDFNDGIIPLYISSQHLNRKVVLVVLRYRAWWYDKYHHILSQLSDYPPIDFFNDTRTHCFPGAIVGLRYHGILAIDAVRMQGNKTIADFQYLLDEAYNTTTSRGAKQAEERPKLVFVSRRGTRAVVNEGEVVKLGKKIGFEVEVLRPTGTMPVATIYRKLRTSCDVMIGVHGAAMTHFLFMKPGSVFIQIVPYGLSWLSRICYEEPAVKMGLLYEKYDILPRESSLHSDYNESDQVFQNPEKLKARGWKVTKELYLGQNVTIDLNRLQEHLLRAFRYVASKK